MSSSFFLVVTYLMSFPLFASELTRSTTTDLFCRGIQSQNHISLKIGALSNQKKEDPITATHFAVFSEEKANQEFSKTLYGVKKTNGYVFQDLKNNNLSYELNADSIKGIRFSIYKKTTTSSALKLMDEIICYQVLAGAEACHGKTLYIHHYGSFRRLDYVEVWSLASVLRSEVPKFKIPPMESIPDSYNRGFRNKFVPAPEIPTIIANAPEGSCASFLKSMISQIYPRAAKIQPPPKFLLSRTLPPNTFELWWPAYREYEQK